MIYWCIACKYHTVYLTLPLLVIRPIVDGVALGLIVCDVEFETVVRPRDEDELALLAVEGEMAHVERAVGLGHCGEHPQHASIAVHYGVRVHEVLETVVRTAHAHTIVR